LSVFQFRIANAGEINIVHGGCETCSQGGAPSDPFRKFYSDTNELRQEMMLKRTEAQRENLKGTPDKGKTALLQAEIKNIQAKILLIRNQRGLPLDKSDGECGQSTGSCDKNAAGGCGKSSGGCSGGQCGQK
jgi:hypothetical protein